MGVTWVCLSPCYFDFRTSLSTGRLQPHPSPARAAYCDQVQLRRRAATSMHTNSTQAATLPRRLKSCVFFLKKKKERPIIFFGTHPLCMWLVVSACRSRSQLSPLYALWRCPVRRRGHRRCRHPPSPILPAKRCIWRLRWLHYRRCECCSEGSPVLASGFIFILSYNPFLTDQSFFCGYKWGICRTSQVLCTPNPTLRL